MKRQISQRIRWRLQNYFKAQVSAQGEMCDEKEPEIEKLVRPSL